MNCFEARIDERMTGRLSDFIFIEPPRIALNKRELEVIVTHRKAFNLILTASLNPEWKTSDQLLDVTEADPSQIYVLYEFVGDAFLHLQNLNVISPLVVLQSYNHRFKFPIRNLPTWAQTLHSQVINGISFNVDDENDICDKTIKLGGIFKKSVDDETTVILVGIFNPDDAWFKEAVEKNKPILRKEWINKVYESAMNLECDIDRFFKPDFINHYRIPVAAPDDEPLDYPTDNLIAEVSGLQTDQEVPRDTVTTSIFTDQGLVEHEMQDDFPLSPIQTASSTASSLNKRRASRQRVIIVSAQSNSIENRSPQEYPEDNIPDAQRVNMTGSLNLRSLGVEAESLHQNISSNTNAPRPTTNEFFDPNYRLNLRTMGLNITNFQDTANSTILMRNESMDFCLKNAFAKNARLPPNIQPNAGVLSNADVQPGSRFDVGKSTRYHDNRQNLALVTTRRPHRPPQRKIRDSLAVLNHFTSNNSSVCNQIMRSGSPEYLSQGPLMTSGSISSATQTQAVVWQEQHDQDQTSRMESRFLQHSQQPLDKFVGDDINQTDKTNTSVDDLFLDDEERALFNRLYN